MGVQVARNVGHAAQRLFWRERQHAHAGDAAAYFGSHFGSEGLAVVAVVAVDDEAGHIGVAVGVFLCGQVDLVGHLFGAIVACGGHQNHVGVERGGDLRVFVGEKAAFAVGHHAFDDGHVVFGGGNLVEVGYHQLDQIVITPRAHQLFHFGERLRARRVEVEQFVGKHDGGFGVAGGGGFVRYRFVVHRAAAAALQGAQQAERDAGESGFGADGHEEEVRHRASFLVRG